MPFKHDECKTPYVQWLNLGLFCRNILKASIKLKCLSTSRFISIATIWFTNLNVSNTAVNWVTCNLTKIDISFEKCTCSNYLNKIIDRNGITSLINNIQFRLYNFKVLLNYFQCVFDDSY